MAEGAIRAAKGRQPIKHGALKTYEGFPHGMLSTHPDILNPDLLALLKG